MKTIWKSSLVAAAAVLAWASIPSSYWVSPVIAQTRQAQVQRPRNISPPTSVSSAGSATIVKAESQLHTIIWTLQHDPNTYSGHRDKAVQLLTQAQQELEAAGGTASGATN